MLSTANTRVMLRAWQAAAVVGLLAFTLHAGTGLFGAGADSFANRWLYSGLLVLASLACAVRAATVRAERPAWLLLAAAVTSWAVGDIYYTFAFAGLDSPPFRSFADACYLAFYPLVYVALVLLVRARAPEFNRAVWLDGLLATLAAAALGATVLVEAVLKTTEGSLSVVVTNLAYPIGDTLLLALIIGVFTLTAWRPGRNWAFIGAALLVSAVADGIYLYQIASGTYREGTLLDALWPAAMLLLAQAAWESAGRRRVIRLVGRRALATPAVCGLIGVGVLTFGHFHRLNLFAVVLAVATLLAVLVRTAMTFEENERITSRIRTQAVTDPLTGLGNRRSLLADLDETLSLEAAGPSMLIIYDLDGFKRYNDSFGHLAGDALLARLGGKLAGSVTGVGRSYRLGGDEFCVLAPIPTGGAEPLLDKTLEALAESGEGFSVGASFGAVFLPDEATEASEALGVADQRLYAQKHSKSSSRGETQSALLQALYERRPELQQRVQSITDLSMAVGAKLGLPSAELERLRRAAGLHDVGTIAIPDEILRKPGSLTDAEWAFIRRHTEIGQRILGADPALIEVGTIVRSTHERWDGMGYPDALSGESIPLGARIIAVCDAFVAMTSDRPHRARRSAAEALAELRRFAGTQFDPVSVAVLCEVVAPTTAEAAA